MVQTGLEFVLVVVLQPLEFRPDCRDILFQGREHVCVLRCPEASRHGCRGMIPRSNAKFMGKNDCSVHEVVPRVQK